MSRFAERLPYLTFPSLGEGDTPVVELPKLARSLGLDALHVKTEGISPTGSHKDRMSAQFVAHAVASGAPKVVGASSGNAGVSLAAYAAAAGIPCEIVGASNMPTTWRRPLEMMGAKLVCFTDPLERWRYVKEGVERDNWASATNFLDPPVGSHPCGIEGYKTIAFELAEHPGLENIDAIVVPTARGDLLWGIFAGLQELAGDGEVSHMPRLIAVEPFPRIEQVLAGVDYRLHFAGASPLVSINGSTVTLQSVTAIRVSSGLAVSVGPEQVAADQTVLARHGLYLENSGAAPLSALRQLLAQDKQNLRRVILIGTSHGFKGV